MTPSPDLDDPRGCPSCGSDVDCPEVAAGELSDHYVDPDTEHRWDLEALDAVALADHVDANPDDAALAAEITAERDRVAALPPPTWDDDAAGPL